MRIGLDGGIFRNAKAGVARYVEAMLTNMMAQAPELEFRLYSPVSVETDLPYGNWRVVVDDFRLHRPATLWQQSRLPALLARDDVDVFWGQNHVLPLTLRHRCVRLLTVHDLAPRLCPETMRLTTRVVSGWLLTRAARKADRVIAVSQATASLCERLLAVPHERVRVIHEGCDIGGVPDPGAIYPGLPSDYLLTVGTIEPRKDHETLLRALNSVFDAPLLVVAGGVGWRCRRTLAQLRSLERSGRVCYLGRVEDAQLRWLYSNARLFICTSRYEGFGLPLLEAMAFGCPVVSTWSSSLPEVGGAAARYFKIGDHEGLARLLNRLLSHPDELQAMRHEGKKRAATFSFASAATRVLECLQELTGHTGLGG